MKFASAARALCITSVSLLFVFTTPLFGWQLTEPSKQDAKLVQLVSQRFKETHFDGLEIDDEISAKLLTRFIDQIDPRKRFFLKSDIDEFMKRENDLDNLILQGDVGFPVSVFKRYLDRVAERIRYAHQLIDANHDFTIDEGFDTNLIKRSWSVDAQSLNERWRLRIKYDVLDLLLTDAEIDDIRTTLHKRYDRLAESADKTSLSKLLEVYLSSLGSCLDPHSSYISEETLGDLRIRFQLRLVGIGVGLRSELGSTYVTLLATSGAAEEDGRLEIGDRILAIALNDDDFIDVGEMELQKVVNRLMGRSDTQIRLRVVKKRSQSIETYDLTPKQLKSPEPVQGEIVETESRIGRAAKIGVIRIKSFRPENRRADVTGTSGAMSSLLDDFDNEGGVEALIIDLRSMAGGDPDEAIRVAGMFLEKGAVVQLRTRDGTVQSPVADMQGWKKTPLIVVCNRSSADCAEFFAAAVQDHHRGIVVGDAATFGSGTAQNVRQLRLSLFGSSGTGGLFKFTFRKYYRVNGSGLQKKGVESDIELPSVMNYSVAAENTFENALAFDRIEPVDIETMDLVDSKILKTLRRQSRQRIDDSSHFANVREEITRFLEDKDSPQTVSLNEKKRLTEREELRRKHKNRDVAPDKNAILPAGDYNNELLNIAVDYLELRQGRKR